MVDFDQAEHNGFEKSIGAQLTRTLIHGCSFHWKTSVNRVNDIVTRTRDEHAIFRHLAYQIEDCEEKESVSLIFYVLCGKVGPSRAKHLLSENFSLNCVQVLTAVTGIKPSTG